jgi:hypothetical protein
MKKSFFIFILLFCNISFSQNWIPFQWEGDSIGKTYFDKAWISIPISLNELPYKFKMQFDLGAVHSTLYENNIQDLLIKHPDLKQHIDTNFYVWIQNVKQPIMQNLQIKLGDLATQKHELAVFKNHGTVAPLDTSNSSSILIGTIAPDFFQNKILIIDYPNARLCISDSIPNVYKNASFSNFEQKYGRIFIHFNINGKDKRLMFDTGSSLFSLITTRRRANQIAERKIIDKMIVNSWGKNINIYSKKLDKEVKFGTTNISSDKVYYCNKYKLLFFMLKIWGITGNANFLENTVIVDYKNGEFGVK